MKRLKDKVDIEKKNLIFFLGLKHSNTYYSTKEICQIPKKEFRRTLSGGNSLGEIIDLRNTVFKRNNIAQLLNKINESEVNRTERKKNSVKRKFFF